MNDLTPYICNIELDKYTYYIPYVTHDINIQTIANQTFLISKFLDLPMDRKNYSPSYTYSFSNSKHEIGFTGTNLEKIKESIIRVQQKLKNKNCIVNDDLTQIIIL
jgi:hypothetical protein